MEQRPFWEANRISASQIPRMLWNSENHYHIHSGLAIIPILSHINTVHVSSISWRSISILFYHLRLRLPSIVFVPGFFLYASVLFPHSRFMPHASHAFCFNHRNYIPWAVRIIKITTIVFPNPLLLVCLRPKYLPQPRKCVIPVVRAQCVW